MILPLLVVCQLAASRGELVLRVDDSVARVAVETRAGAQYVAASALRVPFASKLRTLPNGRIVLELAGDQYELAHQVPFVRTGEQVIPLAFAPQIRDTSVLLPIGMFTDAIPRVNRSMRYDQKTRTLSLATSAPVAAPVQSQPAPVKVASAAAPRRRIVLDAGHGGPDEGTSVVMQTGAKVVEKTITLSVTRLLGTELARRNFDVVYTRTSDTLIALHDRGRLANRNHGDAFVSVHVNSAGSWPNRTAARGVETYFLSVAKTEDAKRLQAIENDAARFEDPGSATAAGDPLSFILGDMQQNDHLRESSQLAAAVQSGLAKAHPGGDRGVKQAEFAVLVGSFMPAVLVEIGFLSNRSDAAFLTKAENQKKIAVSIADAISGYFTDHDKRIAATGKRR